VVVVVVLVVVVAHSDGVMHAVTSTWQDCVQSKTGGQQLQPALLPLQVLACNSQPTPGEHCQVQSPWQGGWVVVPVVVVVAQGLVPPPPPPPPWK